jgi:hypothetical protein
VEQGYHDGLAGSILYRDLLAAWRHSGVDFPLQPVFGALSGGLACAEKARADDTCVATLVEFLDGQLKQALLASDGLCLPHLRALAQRLRMVKRAAPGWLMDFQRAWRRGS